MKDTLLKLMNLIFPILVICFLSTCKENNDDQINHWQTIFQNDDLYLYSIKFLDKDHGFVMADSAGIHGLSGWKFVLSTNDGGSNWDCITCYSYDTLNQDSLYDIGYVYPISKNVLLSTGYCIHKSYDKGKTWKNISSNDGSSISDLYIIDSITWLVSRGRQIIRTDDGGQTWQTVLQTNYQGAFEHFSFATSDIGYINYGKIYTDNETSFGLIYKTTDRGQTWTLLNPDPWTSNGTLTPYIYYLQFITEEIGYLSTFDSYYLYKSADGGNIWNLVHKKNNTTGLQYFINEDEGYYSDGLSVYSTKDGGKTWKVDFYYSDTNSRILAWTFLTTGDGYAVTNGHKILKRTY
jgi:photosystem II stability/assembly factor-like uncharacterized protein